MALVKTSQPTLLGKPIEFVASAAFHVKYGGLETILYTKTAHAVLKKYPHDMLVFEMPDEEHYRIRLAGYHLKTGHLDETSVVFKTQSLKIETFWCKVDDYGDKYVATFLFPSDY